MGVSSFGFFANSMAKVALLFLNFVTLFEAAKNNLGANLLSFSMSVVSSGLCEIYVSNLSIILDKALTIRLLYDFGFGCWLWNFVSSLCSDVVVS